MERLQWFLILIACLLLIFSKGTNERQRKANKASERTLIQLINSEGGINEGQKITNKASERTLIQFINSDGEIVEECILRPTGRLPFPDLPYGHYTVIERKFVFID